MKVYDDPLNALVTTPPNPHLAYLDYNVYSATPSYTFGYHTATYQVFTQAQMQGFGFEHHSRVASASSVYVDQVSYVLKPPFLTAGRYGDPVGPDNVAQILDLTRYGPAAAPGGPRDSVAPGAPTGLR